MIRSFGTRPCATLVLIVHTFVATVMFPEIDIFDGGVNDSAVPDESTHITPNADSAPTRRCESDRPDSATYGILKRAFEVSVVSVPALNGDCDILI